ncbi:beta-ketoacyl-[acyl-carrier-protein] synthase family protein [Streptomyces sp. NPDC054904]|uniref:beta-ketoacyl-[acyl-carrier-protein] synthase family protein n=1 Tax=unclassified Streptomyces TaxID=2593676 RepID=UPI002481E61C|nr:MULTISPECIES: beta-ketoacyl-[acyl-carrier-protein] synthase family protein [unclassified Streptomyces]MDA5279763.1 beta-ketoacyl-[acyl-carrier-protein] synthase family protein [Streptomyces sp. Isolate_45]MDX2391464.1 beta-ketoacyl-[acyl-carrier-protein] synthase family protein [Streptomyces sp. DK15]
MTRRHAAAGPGRHAERPRVVVTGIGVKSPAGLTLDEVMDTVLAARPTAAVHADLIESGSPVHIACRVPEFDIASYITHRERRQIDRPTELALCAAADAVRQAALPDLPPSRVGVHLGTGIGGLPTMEGLVRDNDAKPTAMPVHSVPRTMANSAAARVAMRFGFQGSCVTYSTACASGATAIGEAARRIQYGELDVAVAGGFDSAVTTFMLSGFSRMQALSTRNDDPGNASRPFDARRDGFVMGEGAAVLVLERRDSALRRGATILGEIAGYATNADAHHIVAPHADGAVAAACMAQAVADAGLLPSDIGQISAHGTSTQANDRAEAAAIHRCFNGQAPPVTAVKGVTGHLIGGSGALEAAIALVCAERRIVPPVANLTTASEADRIDVVAGAPRRVDGAPVLSNSFGFGGQNVCLVLQPAT